jgi:hypothetical protein
MNDRYVSNSEMIASPLPVELRHQAVGDPTLAAAILDQLVRNAHRLNIKAEVHAKAKGHSQSGIIDP